MTRVRAFDVAGSQATTDAVLLDDAKVHVRAMLKIFGQAEDEAVVTSVAAKIAKSLARTLRGPKRR